MNAISGFRIGQVAEKKIDPEMLAEKQLSHGERA
jgi:hypothetical protein